ncbi:MAG TPA: hypothetical protein P5217_03120 [Methanoregulaceae archaeon]|nr:hypothetical protein [Methanoregulaceae archaeon]HPD75004.1 hypothetical protein [Methanoregulaceae archaeon]HRY75251.1 hypothetical protein [Methanoregulaceae archaeon]
MTPGQDDIPAETVSALKEKYREVLIKKLTRDDLDELRFYLDNQILDHRIDAEYRKKLEWKLRHYLHEDVLRREFASIEALLAALKPEDLGG